MTNTAVRAFPGAHALMLMLMAMAALPDAHAQSYFGSHVADTLCKAGESVMFACPSKQKQIAVCAAAAGGSPFGVLHYRFGTSGNTELEFPTQAVPPRQFASGNRLGDGGRGSLVYLRLNHGDTSYTVFFEAVNPTYQRRDARERSGVLVERRGKRLATLMCDPEARTYAGMLVDPKFMGDAVPLDARVPLGFPGYK